MRWWIIILAFHFLMEGLRSTVCQKILMFLRTYGKTVSITIFTKVHIRQLTRDKILIEFMMYHHQNYFKNVVKLIIGRGSELFITFLTQKYCENRSSISAGHKQNEWFVCSILDSTSSLLNWKLYYSRTKEGGKEVLIHNDPYQNTFQNIYENESFQLTG